MEGNNNLIWVTQAKSLTDYCLELTFNNGKRKVFDCKPLIERYPFFKPLKDARTFDAFSLDGWTVTWLNGKIDIAPEHLYQVGIPA